MDYSILSDEELVELSKKDDDRATDFLIERNKSFIKSIAHGYFLEGGDTEDLIQEGMIALYKAIRSFSREGGATFKTYATKCIKNAMLTIIRKYNTIKSKPMFQYEPLDDNMETVVTIDPQDSVINNESAEELMLCYQKILSGLEYKILKLYLSGYSYLEIGEKLNKPVKSVDNAIQRIRKKLVNNK